MGIMTGHTQEFSLYMDHGRHCHVWVGINTQIVGAITWHIRVAGHYHTQIVGGFTIHGLWDSSLHMGGINVCGLHTWHIQGALPYMDH